MNYPVWDLGSVNGGFLIALIAVLHVFIAHLAVGGGLFLVLTESRAHRRADTALMAYVKKHTRFFLLLTMVFGGITGVGIWFIIALISPAATSSLIHNFVFGWATEWVFFIGEIVALLIYYYYFDKMKRENHIVIGWLYFIFAWMSLFIINGIIGFMLTPGGWLESGSFWQGFFNPSFWPSLFFRTGIAFFVAGLFGLITAVFNKDIDFRRKLFRYCLKWLYLPFILIFISAIFYLKLIPAEAVERLFQVNPEATQYVNVFLVSTIIIFILGLLFLIRSAIVWQRIAVFLLVLTGLAWMGGFEYLREIARKPFVIYNHMYSNSISVDDMKIINQESYLKTAKWSSIKEITNENSMQAGEELMRFQCMSCHSLGGSNDLIQLTSHLTERGMLAKINGLGSVDSYMPPFAGTYKEQQCLAAYIIRTFHPDAEEQMPAYTPEQELVELPAFDMQKDEYVLLAWNDLGMHCISDNDTYFSFLPPANTIWAQLFKRGPKPEIITEGVEIRYSVQPEYENPEDYVDFWEMADKVYGAKLEPGTGLGGKRLSGHLEKNMLNTFVAHLIPVTPYRSDGTYNPYPVFTITAYDKESGKELVSTKVVAPTATEMGCRNCHQGGWRWNDIAGVSDKTARNILEVHDRINGTSLLADAENGNPKLCQSCHMDPALNAPGRPGVLNFSSAIHGFHANYLKGLEDESCNLCHPSSPEGITACLRGRHKLMGMNCTHCHGRMEDHAISLLKNEQELQKIAADGLIKNLNPTLLEDKAQVKSRIPWLKEPDCISCHADFDVKQLGYRPNAFNKWVEGGSHLYRNRPDNHGVMCAACHGAPHAIYFADNKYGAERDNLQPVMYQGLSGTIGTNHRCEVCHIKSMKANGHHRNMLKDFHMFRKPNLTKEKLKSFVENEMGKEAHDAKSRLAAR